MPTPEQDAQQLVSTLSSLGRVVVAFSGGVDSSVVAAAAYRAIPELAVAVTAQSPSVARWQIEWSQRIAAEIGIQHHVLATTEGDRREYRRNDQQRCFFCKETLYESLDRFCSRFANVTIVSGTNADDLGDHRPGIEAGRRAGVVTPLADLGLSKARVRDLAKHFGLSNCDLPASPCLASRIAYGTEVTAERLSRIEQAEHWLRLQGLSELRVRLHQDELARIEVPKDQIGFLVQLDSDGKMTRVFQDLGFKFVTIDLEGFRSGSMNRVLVRLGGHISSNTKESCLEQ